MLEIYSICVCARVGVLDHPRQVASFVEVKGMMQDQTPLGATTATTQALSAVLCFPTGKHCSQVAGPWPPTKHCEYHFLQQQHQLPAADIPLTTLHGAPSRLSFIRGAAEEYGKVGKVRNAKLE